MSGDYSDEIDGLENTLESLIAKRTDVNRQIQHVTQALENLYAAQGKQTNPELAALADRQVAGLTSSVEQVLNLEPRVWKTTGDMRKLLKFYGVSISKYANASAVVRTVLERLVKRGYAERDPDSQIARYRRDMRPLDEEIDRALKGKKDSQKK